MKINDTLECINTALKNNNYHCFFVLHPIKEKHIGNYYTYKYTIYVLNETSKDVFVQLIFTEQIKDGQEEEIKERQEKNILTSFLTKLLDTKTFLL